MVWAQRFVFLDPELVKRTVASSFFSILGSVESIVARMKAVAGMALAASFFAYLGSVMSIAASFMIVD